MMKNFVSRYRPRYVRSLVYMLQATEYNVGDYLAWYRKTHDFGSVERRKSLVKTGKVQLILLISYTMLIALYGASLALLFFPDNNLRYFLCGVGLLITPYLLAYLIIIPIFAIRVLQWPVERAIMRDAQQRLEKHPAFKIAVAGSFGKTSMREILKTVLAEGKKVAAPPHSYNTPLGISKFVKSLKGDEEVIIFEFGEYYPGDVRKLCGLVGPQMGVITGVNEAHLDKFKSLEATAKTIFELAAYLQDQPVYVNAENELARKNSRKQDIGYSREGCGEWKVSDPHTDLDGTQFKLIGGEVEIRVQTKLLGLHQIGPLAAAADIAGRLGLSAKQIEEGLAKTKPFDHRMEPKSDSSGVTTLDDSYNGNPDGVRAVIEFLATLSGHRRIYVTPGLVEMGPRTVAIHREIGTELARAGIEKVILIKNSVTPYIQEGLAEAKYPGEVVWFDEALAAFSALPNLTVKGDVVLLQNDWPDQYS
jgi:UDP-N-acetylmuramoyl-tripeptide--D-alanyl-D-alanine ligase